jgi:HSP20 family molecular chaperone IbpA
MMSWLPHWRGWPLLAEPIRVEEFAEDGSYVVRAELPGVDPKRDISVMVADGELTIGVNRVQRSPGTFDSEFHYGPAERTLVLPRRAKDETAAAHYDGGILEVRIELARRVPIGRKVSVRSRPVDLDDG